MKKSPTDGKADPRIREVKMVDGKETLMIQSKDGMRGLSIGAAVMVSIHPWVGHAIRGFHSFSHLRNGLAIRGFHSFPHPWKNG
jgi:hypothetical protein